MSIKEKIYNAQALVRSLKETLQGSPDELGEIKARLFSLYLRNEVEDKWILELEGIQHNDHLVVISHFCGETVATMPSEGDETDFINKTAKFIEDCLNDWGEDGKVEWIGE